MDRLNDINKYSDIDEKQKIQNANSAYDIIELLEKTEEQIFDIDLDKYIRKELKYQFDKVIVWQDQAKESFIRTLLNLNTLTEDKEWLLWSMMFLWPSWVWKTQLVKEFTRVMLWDPNMLTIVSCERFTESHTVRDLLWSPKSFVWYSDPPILADTNIYNYFLYAKQKWLLHPLIQNMPLFWIILFDEIEKAHPTLIKTLMWAMQNWYVELSTGREDDPKLKHSKFTILFNTIFVFTSNIWADVVRDENNKNHIWFGKKPKVNRDKLYTKTLNKNMPTEFLWRLSDIITFDRLTEQDAKKIVDINIKKLWVVLNKGGWLLNLVITDEAKQFIVDKSFDINYGARRIKQYIDKTVWSKISQLFSSNLTRVIDDLAKERWNMYEFVVCVVKWQLTYKIKKIDIHIIRPEKDEWLHNYPVVINK